MKLRTIVVMLAIACTMCFAQTEKLATDDGAQVTVHHHGGNCLSEAALHELHSGGVFPGIGTDCGNIAEDISEKPHIVHVVAKHADGTVFFDETTHNLRTTGGADWQANSMSATSSRPAAANFIAVSNDATSPAAGDCAAGSVTCTLTSEIVTNGLSRVQATYAHSNGTASYTLTTTFTASGTQSAQKAAVFNAASSGTMVFEALFTQVSLVTSDTVTITWTISI